MKRDPALIKLSREHHSGLMLAQLIKKGAPNYKDLPSDTESKLKYTLSSFSEELLPHFKCEEDILIPSISGKDNGIDSISSDILSEHERIYGLIEMLKNNIDVETILDKLGILLDDHIRKEERIWFEKIQSVLSEEELIELGKNIGI